MRLVLTCLVIATMTILSIAGLRGTVSRRPPIELFSDMVRQLRLRPQEHFEFFADGYSSRTSVYGSVARGAFDTCDPWYTGRVRNGTNFLEHSPVIVTRQLLERGRERFTINCSPCHGAQGDGKGITTKLGLTAIASLHDPRIVRMLDGELFNAIANGRGLMQGYGRSIAPGDRWAIVAFVRALQLSHLGLTNDVPAQIREELGEQE